MNYQNISPLPETSFTYVLSYLEKKGYACGCEKGAANFIFNKRIQFGKSLFNDSLIPNFCYLHPKKQILFYCKQLPLIAFIQCKNMWSFCGIGQSHNAKEFLSKDLCSAFSFNKIKITFC